MRMYCCRMDGGTALWSVRQDYGTRIGSPTAGGRREFQEPRLLNGNGDYHLRSVAACQRKRHTNQKRDGRSEGGRIIGAILIWPPPGTATRQAVNLGHPISHVSISQDPSRNPLPVPPTGNTYYLDLPIESHPPQSQGSAQWYPLTPSLLFPRHAQHPPLYRPIRPRLPVPPIPIHRQRLALRLGRRPLFHLVLGPVDYSLDCAVHPFC